MGFGWGRRGGENAREDGWGVPLVLEHTPMVAKGVIFTNQLTSVPTRWLEPEIL